MQLHSFLLSANF